jgi:hypothetical protein
LNVLLAEVRGYNTGEFECQEEGPVEEEGEPGDLVRVSLLSGCDLVPVTQELLIHQTRLAQFMSQQDGEAPLQCVLPELPMAAQKAYDYSIQAVQSQILLLLLKSVVGNMP